MSKPKWKIRRNENGDIDDIQHVPTGVWEGPTENVECARLAAAEERERIAKALEAVAESEEKSYQQWGAAFEFYGAQRNRLIASQLRSGTWPKQED